MEEEFYHYTAKKVKLFIVEDVVGIFFIIFAFHMRLWTFGILLGIIMFFYILEQNKISFTVFLKLVRSFFGGKIKKIRKSNR
jgi:hypothetical protein